MNKERLIELMELLKMTPTQFAAAIGVQRATLQHILSGRNEPSLKIITAIHNSYPDVELEWLLSGKGSAIPSLSGQEENSDSNRDYPFLPGFENEIKQTGAQTITDFQNVKEEKPLMRSRKKAINKEVNPSEQAPKGCMEKNIKEVVVFFDDGTYQKFSSDLKK